MVQTHPASTQALQATRRSVSTSNDHVIRKTVPCRWRSISLEYRLPSKPATVCLARETAEHKPLPDLIRSIRMRSTAHLVKNAGPFHQMVSGRRETVSCCHHAVMPKCRCQYAHRAPYTEADGHPATNRKEPYSPT